MSISEKYREKNTLLVIRRTYVQNCPSAIDVVIGMEVSRSILGYINVVLEKDTLVTIATVKSVEECILISNNNVYWKHDRMGYL